jgi:hypothetical protein
VGNDSGRSMSGDRKMLRVMFKERRSSKDLMVQTSPRPSATKYDSLAPEQRVLELPVEGAGKKRGLTVGSHTINGPTIVTRSKPQLLSL